MIRKIIEKLTKINTLNEEQNEKKTFEVILTVSTSNPSMEYYNVDDYVKDLIDDKKELKVISVYCKEVWI